MQYFFIFGNHPELSTAELLSKLKTENINYSIIDQDADFLILDIASEFNQNQLISELGGTIKIGLIKKKINDLSPNTIAHEVEATDKKINFGISLYNKQTNLNKLGLQIKKLLKEKNVKCRFVTGKENPLSSVIVQSNILNKQGFEFVILKSDKAQYLGLTQTVQPYELFSHLDFGRPSRDDISGMLPPKLAQIMLNLAELTSEASILDPFCGSGTVLQQSLLSGHKNVTGTDASKKAILSCQLNLEWLKSELKKKFIYKIKLENVVTLENSIKLNSIDAIITEPFLGPPLRGNEPVKTIQHISEELTKLYEKSFKSFKKILKKNGVIVIIIPEFKTLQSAEQINVRHILPDCFDIENVWHYSRPNQQVRRTIYKIVKS